MSYTKNLRGELQVTLPKDKPINIRSASIMKFMDYCIINMDYSGRVEKLENLSDVCRDWNLVINGTNEKKIKRLIDYCCNTEMDLKINLDSVSFVDNKKDYFLRQNYIEYTASDGSKKVWTLYRLPASLIEYINNNKYKIYRPPETFYLNDYAYEMMNSIHGKMRMANNLNKREYAINFNSFQENDTSRSLTKNARRDMDTIHQDIEELVNCKLIEDFYITERKTGNKMPKDWYRNKEIKLILRGSPNYELMRETIYHFVITNRFMLRNEKR